MSELLPCPFCGGKHGIGGPNLNEGATEAWIFCSGCGARHGYCSSELAVRLWNARHQPEVTEGWIPVEERMPEPEHTVMWCKVPVVEPYVIMSVLDCTAYADQWADFTHWMPLPLPPSALRNESGI